MMNVTGHFRISACTGERERTWKCDKHYTIPAVPPPHHHLNESGMTDFLHRTGGGKVDES